MCACQGRLQLPAPRAAVGAVSGACLGNNKARAPGVVVHSRVDAHAEHVLVVLRGQPK